MLDFKFHKAYSFDDIKYFLNENDDFYIIGEINVGNKVITKLQNKYKKRIKGFINLRPEYNQIIDVINSIDYKSEKIIIASYHGLEISKYLIEKYKLQYLKDFIFFDHINLSENPIFIDSAGTLFYNYYKKHLDKYQEIFTLLSNDLSKITYEKIISYRIKAFHPESIDLNDLPMPILMQYEQEKNADLFYRLLPEKIPPALRGAIAFKLSVDPYSYLNIVKYSNKREILNIGAYNNTSVMFAFNSRKSNIYAFEPQLLIHEDNVKLSAIFPEIKPICKGVWQESCDLPFFINNCDLGGTTSSHVSMQGTCTIEAVSIDDFTSENKIMPDFVKIDIEGNEMEALKGGENTISKYLPDLAISIYHKPEHLYQIPVWIKSISDKYKLYISHKYYGFTETVCFATAYGK